MFTSSGRRDAFRDLVQAAQGCDLCARMAGRRKILSERNGDLDSKVLFVAEAPGRLGADRTGMPLNGDATGDRFETLLANVGWHRSRVFVTNAVLCNPRDAGGNNDAPSRCEVHNCLPYLDMTVALVDPAVVVALGQAALEACDMVSRHSLTLGAAVATPVPWYGRHLFPLYHPGPRAAVHRSLPKQRSDYMKLARFVDPAEGLLPQSRRGQHPNSLVTRPSVLMRLALAIVGRVGEISYFRLTKLLYLVDLVSLRLTGLQATGEAFLRQADGPWAPALPRAIRSMWGYELTICRRAGLVAVRRGPQCRFESSLSAHEDMVLAQVIHDYGSLNESQLKTAVYLTAPMRYVLEQETRGRDMRNVPVLYKDKTMPQLDHGRNPVPSLFDLDRG